MWYSFKVNLKTGSLFSHSSTSSFLPFPIIISVSTHKTHWRVSEWVSASCHRPVSFVPCSFLCLSQDYLLQSLRVSQCDFIRPWKKPTKIFSSFWRLCVNSSDLVFSFLCWALHITINKSEHKVSSKKTFNDFTATSTFVITYHWNRFVTK